MMLLHTLVALAVLNTATAAAATFLRCTIIEALNAVFQNGWHTSYSTSLTTVDACSTFCAADVAKPGYAYFDPGNFVCACSTASDVLTAGSVYRPAADASGTCPNGIVISAVTTRYGPSTCFTSYGVIARTNQMGTPELSPVNCMWACLAMPASYDYVAYAPGKCACIQLAWFDPDTTCEDRSLLFPRQSNIQPTAGLQYRRAREQARLAAQANKHCPRGLEACVVSGTSGYECVDTQAELESCGGCLHGSLGNGTAGVDCTALEGPDRSVTCLRGRCIASGCVRGYTLHDGVCL